MHSGAQTKDQVDLEDTCLVAAFLDGKQSAFDELFNKHKDRVFSLCFRFLGCRSDAEDVLQEVFLDIHSGLRSFRADAAFSTWAYRITIRKCYSRLRGRKPNVPLSDELLYVPERADLNQDDRIAIRQGIAKLSGEYRMLLILRYYQQLSYEEMGLVLSYDLKKVKSRLRLARLSLKSELEKGIGGGSI